jgi:hypothetical protein
MANSKIELSLGTFNFSCEGDKEWVEAQLQLILDKSPEILKLSGGQGVATNQDVVVQDEENHIPEKRRGRKPQSGRETSTFTDDPLIDYLKEKKADNNQVKKFLATAVFLHSQGGERFSTPIISKKLKSANIPKLANASDCLNKNARKGFVIKEDKEFVITEEGIKAIIGV